MTTFGDQVRQYGGVPVGINRLAEIFNKDNIWFVDSDNGATAHGGQKPDDAFALPSEAVSAASKEGIIYIRPRTSITSSDVYYSDNITCTIAKPHLQFIGCGAGTVPGYRGSAQIRPLTTTSPIFDIQGSGVTIENLHLNNSGATASTAIPINSQRLGHSGAVCLQVRQCRIIDNVTDQAGAIVLKSAQYNIIEDNIFLDCVVGIQAEATSGSPQSYTIRRNIFEGLVLTRDVDINIVMTDINSRGHVIADNIFADGQPNSASARHQLFISASAPTTAVSTGIISGNYFSAVTGQTYSTTGTAVKVPAGWFLVGNYDADGFAA